MKDLIAGFSGQLQQASSISGNSPLTHSLHEIKNVVICGMGGSGIGGNIVSEAISSVVKIPVAVNKDYDLPPYADKHSLVIISSYSGNTEETIKAFGQALKKGTKIVCITSGGKIAEVAKLKDIDLITIPGGIPPRAAIGYSISQILYILYTFHIISSSYKKELAVAVKLLDKEEKQIRKEASKTAKILFGKFIMIYSIAKMESVALRFRQQLNENAKVFASHHVFPEMNHNELEAWKHQNRKIAVVIFRNENDYSRTAKRIDISKRIIKTYTPFLIEKYSKGNSALARMLYLIHWGDWVSFFLANMSGTDMMDISAINFLKSELSGNNE